MKYIITSGLSVGVALLSMLLLTSCSGFLDRKPLDQVGPDTYYKTAEQVGTLPIRYYPEVFGSHEGWQTGIGTFDNGTDNQAGVGANDRFTKDRWKVPNSGGIGFNSIRNLNWFCQTIEKRLEENTYAGEEELARHYLAEGYVIRAMLYYGKLRQYGDYPILTDYVDDTADLVELSKRQPRNEVARFILKELDKAIPMLMEKTPGNQRISRSVAQVLKARIALYEGTFEKYHRGSGRVPGDPQWPGRDKEWNKGKTFDQDAEVNFFLQEAMSASKAAIAGPFELTASTHQIDPKEGQIHGWNPYYEMFGSFKLDEVPEVMLWRQYSKEYDIIHRVTQTIAAGSGTGWTRGLVESFLMQNGLPIYSQGSGYQGDVTLDQVREGRDERLRLFMFGESTPIRRTSGDMDTFKGPRMVEVPQNRDVTGYVSRKYFNYDPVALQGDQSGAIAVRLSEAYLIYIEASYEKNHSLDADARQYWTALRARAGITAPLETTINATDMTYEADVNRDSYDWGAFSAGKAIDPTLYSIRRERRSELASEGYRWDDLIRWRAMDQVTNYHIEGVNFWDKIYTYETLMEEDKDGNPTGKSKVLADQSAKANISSKEISKYHRPYQIVKANNPFFDGYTFYPVHYLSPFSVREMELTSPDENVETSNLYQNPGWPLTSTFPEYTK